MTNRLISRAGSIAAVLAVTALVAARGSQSSSSSSASPAPPATVTNPVPEQALTPGTGIGATPGHGSDLYAIPKTTPAGMPAYSITAGPGISSGPSQPASLADCGGGGWRNYAALKFTSQGNCEKWVRQHPSGAAPAGSMTTPLSTTPRPRRTPRSAPSPTTTPR